MDYYSNRNLKFQGIYNEGMEWEGKGYNNKGEQIYEIKEGKGTIKRYNYKGMLQLEGEILDGKLNGYIKEYKKAINENDYTIIFEGFYLKGKRNGYGKEYKYGKIVYEGNFLNDKRHGHGKLFINDGNISFEGEFLYGYENIQNIIKIPWEGEGTEYNDCGNIIFKGIYKNGKRNGYGKEYYNNSYLSYEGYYLNDEKNGYFKEYNISGELRSEGKFEKGLKVGLWKKYYAKGEYLEEGEYENDKKIGIWKRYYENGQLEYEGEYKNGMKNGIFKEYHKKGELKFQGEYLNNKKNGKGKEFNETGKLLFEGEYKEDQLWNGKQYNYYDSEQLRSVLTIRNGNLLLILKYNNDGELIFETKYIEEKKKLFIKQFFNGILIFEGEYKDKI